MNILLTISINTLFVCVRYDSKASASESSVDGGDSDEDRKKKPAKKAKFVKERKPRKKEVRKKPLGFL